VKKEILLNGTTKVSAHTTKIPDFFGGEVGEDEFPKFIWEVEFWAGGATTGPDAEYTESVPHNTQGISIPL
jgi:hypothetical protein